MKYQLSRTRLALTSLITSAVLIACDSGSSVSSTTSNDSTSNDTSPPSAPVNIPPVAKNACEAYKSVDSPLIGQLADYANDPDGSALEYSLKADASKGTVAIDLASGQFTYTASTSERGYMDYFTYSVTDSNGESAEGTVAVVVGERRIMPFGDSITAGVTNFTGVTGDQPVIPERVGYRKHLNEDLRADGYAIDFVGSEQAGQSAGLEDADHQGHPGFTTTTLANQVTTWLNSNPADVMLIHVGTNDLSTSAAPVEQLLQQIQNWQTLNHPVDVLVSTIIDHHADTFWEDVVEDYNADLRQRIETNWPDVTLVDQYSALDNVTDMSPLSIDSVGLHPNASGYDKMAHTWLAALKSSAAVTQCGAAS